jgi:succinyl-diaminopimelate desuccinylase
MESVIRINYPGKPGQINIEILDLWMDKGKMNEIERKVISEINETEMINFIQKLIQCKSCYPPGDTIEIADILAEKMKNAGIATKIVYPPEEITSALGDHTENCRVRSVLGEIKGSSNGPVLLLNAHIDTVSPGDMSNWEYNPFEAVIKDNKVFGRGAGDDKGSVAAQVMAAAAIARAGVELKGTLQINPVADEEASSNRGTRWLKEAGCLNPDYLIVGEQTDNIVCIAERAVLWLKVTIKGKAAHGAMPWAGNNAVARMSEFICRVNHELAIEFQKRKHPFLPSTSISTTKIEGGIKTNIIPEICTLEIDCRLAPGDTEGSVLREVEGILTELSEKGQAFEWRVEILQSDGKPIETDSNDKLVTTMLEALNEVSGHKHAPGGYNQASDARIFSETGIPIVIFGPGDPSLGHAPNEYISIDQLLEATKTYALIILRLIG